MERQIQIPQTIDRTELFGNLDSNLTLIREATGVDIFQRDNGLLLKGEDLDTAEGILRELTAVLEKENRWISRRCPISSGCSRRDFPTVRAM